MDSFRSPHKPVVNYSLSGIDLTHMTTVNDLDFTFDSKFNFASHCHKIAAKGYVSMNMLLNCFYAKDRSLQFKLFLSSLFIFFSITFQFWSPHFAKDIVVVVGTYGLLLRLTNI